MATSTYGLITREECNSNKYIYSFTSGDLTQYPTKSELLNAGLTVSGTYSNDQLVKYSDVSMSSKSVTLILSNTLASAASLENIQVYINGELLDSEIITGVPKNSSINWTFTLPTPAISKTITISVTIGEAGAKRHWWYADNISKSWTSVSDGATTLNYTITTDYAKWFKDITKLRFNIGNDSDSNELPSLSW